MNALGFIKESIDSKQKELNRFHNDVPRIYAHTDNYGVYMDYGDNYDVGTYSDDWGDYSVSDDED